MNIEERMIDIAIWSEGGLSYSELKQMPADELVAVFKACEKLQAKRKAEIEKARKKK